MKAFVRWGAVETPLGPMLAAVNPEGALLRLTLGESEVDFLTCLEEFLGDEIQAGKGGILRDEEAFSRLRRELGEYFRGERREFSVPVDLSGLTPFQRRVLEVTRGIRYGEVRSYGEVAVAAGRPKGARAVGQALRQNPVCIVVPCHRVVASDGNLRGYSASGGVETKRWLLELEGFAIAEGAVVSYK